MSGFTADTGMLFLLGAAVVLPALVFRSATFDGGVVAVLYREPKKDALTVLGWLVVLGFFLVKGRGIGLQDLARRCSDPLVASLSLLLSCFALTRLWVTVPENWNYEMSQYAMLFLLLLVGLAWSTEDSRVPAVIRIGLFASLALVTVIGAIQWVFPAVVPAAINPFNQVAHPSLMGYKNPAALSVLAQFFILAGVSFAPGRRSRPMRVLLIVLLALELVYIVSLQSRTALFALVCGTAVLVGLTVCNPRARRRRSFIAVGAGLVIVATTLLAVPDSTSRHRSTLRLLANPGQYFETDRGIYLLTTLRMVSHHPLGVGIGDWQTMVPVYRDIDHDVAFDDDFQVRRAHSDHVQVLGEAGWPGLVLWFGFLAVPIWRCAASALREGDSTAAFMTAQLVAISVAMCTDFLIEIPYNKFQFMLVVLLAAVCADSGTVTRSRRPKRAWQSLVVISPLVAVATMLSIATAIQTERKLVGAATSTALTLRAAHPGLEDPAPSRLAEDATAIGNRWATRPGHWKSLFRDHLALAQSAVVLDRSRLARQRAIESLRLYPYNPHALRLMAALSRDPAESSMWLAAALHVEKTSGNGFSIRHPLGEGTTDVTH
ncbi:MAG: O-antigen ligase family protein [Candidatus Sulfomarinibacteraceae bacterium]